MSILKTYSTDFADGFVQANLHSEISLANVVVNFDGTAIDSNTDLLNILGDSIIDEAALDVIVESFR